MDATEGTYKLIVVVSWDRDPKRRESRNYGYWTPKDDMSHLEEMRTFVLAKHGGAPGIETTLYMVENVTGGDPEQVSIAANSIGYALQEAGVELSAELALKAAERLAKQGLLK